MGRRKLCRAYLNLKSYEYFVRGIPVADVVFRYLERDYAYVMEQKSVEEQEEVSAALRSCSIILRRWS